MKYEGINHEKSHRNSKFLLRRKYMTRLWCNGLVDCISQFCCDNEARLPPDLAFSSACFSSSRDSHWSMAAT